MIFDQIREIVSNQFDIEESMITQETMFDELGADSADVEELATAIEERFGVSVEEESFEGIGTVGELADFIE
ncbi:MAG: phosphopantetheine-binding protein, partial [Clostridia bacterium]|nr:phosphopantetheine-binding protein [Clostridia bacterium]